MATCCWFGPAIPQTATPPARAKRWNALGAIGCFAAHQLAVCQRKATDHVLRPLGQRSSLGPVLGGKGLLSSGRSRGRLRQHQIARNRGPARWSTAEGSAAAVKQQAARPRSARRAQRQPEPCQVEQIPAPAMTGGPPPPPPEQLPDRPDLDRSRQQAELVRSRLLRILRPSLGAVCATTLAGPPG